MRIFDIFDAVREGTFADVKRFYQGNVNEVQESTKFNLLCLAVTNTENEKDKIKIINFLIKEGIDINFVDLKFRRNALNVLNFSNWRPDTDYIVKVTDILLNAGIDVNARDKFGATALLQVITLNKFSTEEIAPILWQLLRAGSDYRSKDVFGKNCLDYAQELSWHNGFIDIVKEFENENK